MSEESYVLPSACILETPPYRPAWRCPACGLMQPSTVRPIERRMYRLDCQLGAPARCRETEGVWLLCPSCAIGGRR